MCVVGQKHQFPAAIQIYIASAPQRIRVLIAIVCATQPDGLIADHTGGTVNLARIDSLILGNGFGSLYELTADLVHHFQAREVRSLAGFHGKSIVRMPCDDIVQYIGTNGPCVRHHTLIYSGQKY